MKKIIFMSATVLLFACYPMAKIEMTNLSLGMTKAQAVYALHQQPENLIGAKQYPTGTIEVYQYSKYSGWDKSLQERYWLYFYNDTLKQWGRPGDWQQEADKVYEIRIR